MTAIICDVRPVLAARDVNASIAFFERLGFHAIFRDSDSDPKYAVVRRDQADLHIQWADADQWVAGKDRPVYRFLVDDVDALFKEFENAGAIPPKSRASSPWAIPADTPWGTREFHLHDPGLNGLQFYRLRT